MLIYKLDNPPSIKEAGLPKSAQHSDEYHRYISPNIVHESGYPSPATVMGQAKEERTAFLSTRQPVSHSRTRDCPRHSSQHSDTCHLISPRRHAVPHLSATPHAAPRWHSLDPANTFPTAFCRRFQPFQPCNSSYLQFETNY